MSFDELLPHLPVEVACGRDDDDAVEADPRSTDNSDGHLETDDWWRKHPDAEDLG